MAGPELDQKLVCLMLGLTGLRADSWSVFNMFRRGVVCKQLFMNDNTVDRSIK